MVVEIILGQFVRVVIVLRKIEPVGYFLQVFHVLLNLSVLLLRGVCVGRNAPGCVFETLDIIECLRFLVVFGDGRAQQRIVHFVEPVFAHKQFSFLEILEAFVVYLIGIVLCRQRQDAAQGEEDDGYSFTHNLQIYAKKFFSVKKLCTFAVLSRV